MSCRKPDVCCVPVVVVVVVVVRAVYEYVCICAYPGDFRSYVRQVEAGHVVGKV